MQPVPPPPPASLIADGIYEIISRYSNMAVDDPNFATAAGTIQQQWTLNNGINQKWKITNLSPNVVSIISESSNLALDIANGSTLNSARSRADSSTRAQRRSNGRFLRWAAASSNC